jgi:hypothetical protein
MKERAIEIFDTKEVSPFECEDSFNNNNKLSGFMCIKPDHRYGALLIFQVNDESCEQVIFGTPKLHYPFDKQGTYNWPDVQEVKVWDKLDGTNILAYRYSYKGQEFITYKTRLTQIVKDSALVSFKSMWIEYISENKWVKELIESNPDFNLSFELFGSRNPITIKYEVPLEANFLFGVRRKDAAIKPPDLLKLPPSVKLPSKCGEKISPEKRALTEGYNQLRRIMSAMNTDNLYVEGMVLYAHIGEPSWRMFKCKPEEIEKIHWAASGSIPMLILKNTALNVFEDKENPTVSDLETLLLEEFAQDIINKSRLKIKKIWDWANEHMLLVKNVNEVWSKAKVVGFDVTKDKNQTMRFMSNFFPKGMMSKVGTIVLKQAGLIKEKEKHR